MIRQAPWRRSCVFCLQLISQPLPKVPRDVGITAHWLFINGQQPAVTENGPVEQPSAKRQKLEHKREVAPTAKQAPASKGPAVLAVVNSSTSSVRIAM